MIRFHKLSEDLSKNAQFSKFGQARAAYLGVLVGAMLGGGLALAALAGRELALFGLFLAAQAVFHLLEFTFNARFHPGKLSTNDFLLPWQHSDAFLYAFIAAMLEYWIEFFVAPSLKQHTWLLVLSLVLVATMQTLRTVAMHTAASNFTHQIAEQKTDSHQLVTHGVYAWLRHPSYCGWFWWAIGTQMLLANPLCVIGYAVAAWRFFDDRIQYEEQTLREYFGADYVAYSKKVGTGIPFIR